MRRRARACPLCGVRLTSGLGKPNSKHLDHIIPLAIGGTHTHGNVRIVCRDCNLRRPKDGSDYAGPVTLWAQGPVPVSRPRLTANQQTCRKGLHPWVPANILVTSKGKKLCRPCREANSQRDNRKRYLLRMCQCGVPFAAPGRTPACPVCTEAVGAEAARLHASGLTWDQVAAQTGYASAEGARFAAKRAGYTPAPRPVRADQGCPGCGSPRPRWARWCQSCTEARAQQAAELYRAGATLSGLAASLGYRSITSVSALIKSAATAEIRAGRPSKLRASLSNGELKMRI